MISDHEIFEKVYSRLDAGLPAHLTYHNRHHTEFVVKMSNILASECGVDETTRQLISLAALYHDTGFLIGAENHEEKSCLIAHGDLQEFGLSAKDSDQICGMIMATKIPQIPNTLPEKIVADADLYYFGTNRYSIFSDKLFQEMKHFNPTLTEADWQNIQIDFLSAHQYHTPYARETLEPVKQLHLQTLLTTNKR